MSEVLAGEGTVEPVPAITGEVGYFRVLHDEPGVTVVWDDEGIRYQADVLRHTWDGVLEVFRSLGLRVVSRRLTPHMWEYGQLMERSAFAEEEED